MIENPIFIVGTERSGSNLLRLLLSELPGVAIPHPPHLMRDLTSVLPIYGDLKVKSNFKRLAEDAVNLVRLHFAPWPVELNVERLIHEARTRELYSIYAGIYEQYLEHMNKTRWGCKSTFMIDHVQKILDHHAKPQFIHLVRDPRDVAVSARHSVFCHYHPYFVAKLWQKEQAEAMRWQAALPKETWHTLRYEDLTRDPEGRMQEVCEFLGLPYDAKLLRYFERPAAQQLSSLSRSWENVAQPVLKNNSEKFRAGLTAEEIALIESVTHAEMEHFHYPLVSEPLRLHDRPSSLSLARFHMAEEWMMLREEGMALLKDRNARYRLRKKAFLLKINLSAFLGHEVAE